MTQAVNKGTLLGHPKGLFLLFGTEMWERMSYYGMRGIFVLYLSTIATAAAMGWDMGYFGIDPNSATAQEDYSNALQANALSYLGTYAMLVYLTPVLGGWLADNKIGQRKAIIIGGVLMMLGQFAIGVPHDLIPGMEVTFLWLGLGLMIIGNGFFKPNISTMVGDLYEEGDRRRDSAFTIFYMGINLGSILGYFLVGTIGEKVDYQYGFLAAGVGMGLGVLLQLCLSNRYLGDLGQTPSALKGQKKNAPKVKKPLTPVERDRMKVFLVLSIFNVFFWAGFEQAAGVLNLFAKNNTDLFIMGWEMPASWLQSVNPIFVILFAPIIASIWVKLGDRNPSSPAKFALGLFFLGLGFACMVGAAIQIGEDQSVKASIWWLVMAYMFHTIGELCLSPVGLSMVTKIAPVRFLSFMMGIWFVFMAFGNKLAAEAGKLVGTSGPFNTFLGVTIFAMVAALVLYLIREKLVDWMHGAEDPNYKNEEEALEEEMSVTADHEGMPKKHL
ncbi:peptide MFS transporter [Catenovulum sp. SM1970]|uniref:peptide MFS transporter n=1 Tax=Marinifaba aquimaris TaxID=2741323 RepID=UPI0015721C32|nr:peptide MFS transporter [Marinifaba aquimaris]NTS75481.1 peptide MFS transporter [Marinifaba aquimaris]